MSVTLSLFAGAGAQFLDDSGNVLTGGKIYTYSAGTTTPLATYTSNLGTSAHTNPIILNAAGRISSGELWLTTGFGYKFVLKDTNDVLIATYDNIPSSAQPPIINDASSISYEQGYTVTAGSFVVGTTYQILSVGTTNFQLIGAANNSVGTNFIATGAGSGTGTAQLSRTVQAKLQESVSVLDFGAKGDGVTDDLAAFEAALAALPDTGGSLYIPATTSGIYRFSNTLNIIKPVRIYGQLATATAYVANAGTVLKFDINVIGIVFHAYNTYTSVVLGANYSIMENVAVVSAGGTGAYDGIIIKAPGVRLNNVWSWYWPRHGIHIDGTVGNNAQWRLDNCYTNQNTRAGLFVNGTYASAGVCTQLTTSNNGIYGIYDSSFLGNTYIGPHAEANGTFAYITTGAVNSCVFIGAYTEPPQTSDFSLTTICIGGLGASDGAIEAGSLGTSMTGGLMQGNPLLYLNKKGSVNIGSAVGKNDSSMSAYTFGAVTESPTYDAWKLKFDNTNQGWTLQYANSVLFQPISYINGNATAYTNKGLTGPTFQNGYAVTNTGIASVKVRLLGTAPPATGTYSVGDIVYNSAPASAGYIGWVCTAAGTPGTWNTFGLIS